jgi:adenine/guanine phosphoribosyltransferase-like PRPP-binding protein
MGDPPGKTSAAAVPELRISNSWASGFRGLALDVTAEGFFLRSTSGCLELRRDFAKARVRLRGKGRIAVADLALLALLIRKVADSGRLVEVLWPQKYGSSFSSRQLFLERIGFGRLLTSPENGEWTANVAIRGRPRANLRVDDIPVTRHYIPLQWMDRNAFSFAEVDNLFEAEPSVDPSLCSFLTETLLRQNFLDEDGIYRFVSTNSQNVRSGDGKELRFCVADLGVGIPVTLGSHYEASSKDYCSERGCSWPSAVVLHAFDNDGTQRTVFPRLYSREGYRGLGRVADSLRGRGDIELLSDRGMVKLIPQEIEGVDCRPDDSLSDINCPGVLVMGRLEARSDAAYKDHGRNSRGRPRAAIEIVRACDHDGGFRLHQDLRLTETVVSDVPDEADAVVFDVGYSDTQERDLHGLIRAATEVSDLRGGPRLLVFWNVRSTWEALTDVAQWYARHRQGGSLVGLAFVRSLRDCGVMLPVFDRATKPLAPFKMGKLLDSVFVPQESEGDELGGVPNLRRVFIGVEDYLRITERVNERFIQDGFAQAGPLEGFFAGRIHLLSGEEVQRFFSLALNLGQRSDANLKRWVSTSAAKVVSSLSACGVADSEYSVLGFAAPMRRVMVRLGIALGTRAVYTFLPYDAPSREEISACASTGKHVVLLTDVVSTRSLAREIVRQVKAAGAISHGPFALVESNQPTGLPREDEVSVTETGPDLQRGHWDAEDQPSDTGPEYWVDPVAMIPVPPHLRRFGGQADRRFRQSLDFLCSSPAVTVGHIVDSGRHTSVHVDIRALIQAQEPWVRQRINEEIDARLKTRGWSPLQPSLMLYPSDIARLEQSVVYGSESSAVVVAAYASAAESVCDLLQARWPSAERVEVARILDASGQPRCATVLETRGHDAGDVGDVVIVDDGLCTGRTTQALALAALQRGASRILIVPLLARVGVEELQMWEALAELMPREGKGSAEVLYALPLLLPIPYYSGDECPYETKAARLAAYSREEDVLGEIGDKLAQRLLSSRDKAPDEPFRRTWVRLRALAELSSYDERAPTELVRTIERAEQVSEVRAVLELLLDEEKILGRSGIRQRIGELVRKKAVTAVQRRGESHVLRRTAISLLRSRYPETFLDVAVALDIEAFGDTGLLEQVVFHIATLPRVLREDERARKLLSRIAFEVDFRPASSTGSAGVSDEDRWRSKLITAAHQLLLVWGVELPDASSPQIASRILAMIQGDYDLKHVTRPTLDTLTGDLSSQGYGRKTFSGSLAKWEAAQNHYFRERLLPWLRSLSGILLSCDVEEGPILSSAVKYLTGPHGRTSSQLTQDLSVLSIGLRSLAKDPKSAMFLHIVPLASERLLANVVRENSALVQLLGRASVFTVAKLVRRLKGDIEDRLSLSHRHVVVDVRSLDPVWASRTLFLPQNLASRCVAYVVDNLEEHAYSGVATDSLARVEILVELTSHEAADSPLAITVLNNGDPLIGRPHLSDRSKGINRTLRRFGAGLDPAERIGNRIGHCIHTQLWPQIRRRG